MPDLTITRVFDAPRDVDLRPGGAWRLRQTGFESVEDRDGHREGWSECFDRLEEQLAGVDSANPRSTYR